MNMQTMLAGVPSMPVFLPTVDTPIGRILSRYDRPVLEGFIEVAVALLDALDGDPDAETNGDDLDGTGGEDDFVSHAPNGPGCPVADPDMAVCDGGATGSGDRSYEEWHTLDARRQRAGNITGRPADGRRGSLDEDEEEDDRDTCLARDDNPAIRISDRLPGDSLDTEPNGDEGDHSGCGE